MDELTKQQMMIGVLFFNVTLIAYMAYQFLIVKNVVRGGVNVTVGDVMYHIAIGAAIAIVPGIIGYFVGRMMYK